MIERIFEEQLGRPTVFKNRDALSPHYVPNHLPHREAQIEELSRILAPVLSGRKPENVFIYGKTGTGKTAVTKYVLSKLEDFATKKNLPVRGIYVNCRVHNTQHRVFIKILTTLEPEGKFIGFSTSHLYEQILKNVEERGLRLIIVLDEVDHLKGVADAVYALNRANDELSRGSISIIGISNSVSFRDSLDPRTKSTLCQHEMIFPPYNAEELRTILTERAREGFKEGAVDPAAISLAAAYAANQSGDARYALLLLLRAGDVADEEGANVVTEEHVRRARELVDEDIVEELVKTLPEHERVFLLALANLTLQKKGIKGFGGNVITSGELFEAYRKLCVELGKNPVSERWLREYLSELEMYGLISVTVAGKGFRGNTRIIRLNYRPEKVSEVIQRTL